jgi:uncharacterized protein (TIGR02265 family)
MEKVVFGPSVEALWRAMRPPNAAELEAFAAAGVRDGHGFDAAYPLAPYLKIMDACAKSRFGHLPEQAAYVEVGHLFVEGFARTVIGQALLSIMRVMGPRRTLQRMTRAFRAANNYTEVSIEPVSNTVYRMRVNFVLRPGFYIGVMEHTFAHAGARDVRVTMVEYENQAPIFEVRWS